MPEISRFYGIVIRMYFLDHDPPHFHAQYGEHKAIVDIESLNVLDGSLPRRALELTLDWTELHREALLSNWNLCRENRQPTRISPLY